MVKLGISRRWGVTWRVAGAQVVPLLVSFFLRDSGSAVVRDLAFALMFCSALGPVPGLIWARRSIPGAEQTSFLVLVPVYLSQFLFVDQRAISLVVVPLSALQHYLQPRIGDAGWFDVLDVFKILWGGLFTLVLTLLTAGWQSRSAKRDVAILIAVIIAGLALLFIVRPFAIL